MPILHEKLPPILTKSGNSWQWSRNTEFCVTHSVHHKFELFQTQTYLQCIKRLPEPELLRDPGHQNGRREPQRDGAGQPQFQRLVNGMQCKSIVRSINCITNSPSITTRICNGDSL